MPNPPNQAFSHLPHPHIRRRLISLHLSPVNRHYAPSNRTPKYQSKQLSAVRRIQSSSTLTVVARRHSPTATTATGKSSSSKVTLRSLQPPTSAEPWPGGRLKRTSSTTSANIRLPYFSAPLFLFADRNPYRRRIQGEEFSSGVPADAPERQETNRTRHDLLRIDLQAHAAGHPPLHCHYTWPYSPLPGGLRQEPRHNKAQGPRVKPSPIQQQAYQQRRQRRI